MRRRMRMMREMKMKMKMAMANVARHRVRHVTVGCECYWINI